ncbi:MAG: hypothetical protein HJJLKODD_00779 [Phycisphaerae bacterium]|nr:hypothetical protein [Phycisphaerae bacterium]
MGWDILGWVLLSLGLLVGLLLTVLQLPGTWFILLCAIIYDWVHGFHSIGVTGLVIIGGLAAVAEVMELLAAVLGVQRAKPSPGAGWAALLGGFGGMLLCTPLIPIPVVGTIVGGMIGCFAAVWLVEYRHHGQANQGVKVGWAAMVGRLYGLLAKILAALLMTGVTITVLVTHK